MKRIILLLVLSAILMSQTVFAAADITKVEKKIAGAEAKLIAEELTAGEKVNVRVVYPDVTFVTDGKQNKTIAYMGEAVANENGKIEISILMPESTNKQIVNFDFQVIRSNGTKISKTVPWVDNDGLEETVTNIKQDQSADDAMDEIIAKASVLEIEFLEPYYDEGFDKTKIANSLYAKRNDFEIFDDYLNEINYLIFQEALRTATTQGGFDELLSKYDSLIDAKLFDSFYKDMENTQAETEFKSALFSLRAALDGEAESLANVFKQAVMTAYIKTLDKSWPLADILISYRDILEKKDADMKSVMDKFADDEEIQIEACDSILYDRETELSEICKIIKNTVNPNDGGLQGSTPSRPREDKTSHTISVSVPVSNEEAALNDTVFSDLPKTHYAYDSIYYLKKKGVIDGYDENGKLIFNPEGDITREQFAKMVVSAFDFDIVTENYGFSDVSENSWYAEFVNTGAKLGIINGIGNGKFGTGERITREQMCTMLYRASEIKGIELSEKTSREFSDDSQISGYAYEAVTVLKNAGIVSGDENSNFNPKANATRANVAKVFHMVLTAN